MTGELYTIPFSHYCELARWSLQEAKVSRTDQYLIETRYIFFLHYTPKRVCEV